MSRLDDELKVAFQRQEPSPDFTARVLARINDAPAAPVKPSLWQRLSGLLAMPAWRYAAVGAMAVLLILIGIALLRSQPKASDGNQPSPLAISPGAAGDQANGDNKTTQEKADGSDAKVSVATGDTKASAKSAAANSPSTTPTAFSTRSMNCNGTPAA